MNPISTPHPRLRGRVLVVGAGITGLSAAIEAAEAGCQVVLVEREPHVGGRVAQMYQYFPKLCPPVCGLEINVRRLRTNPRIECLTLAEVVALAGTPGHFRATIHQRARYVGDQCTACGACSAACPIERPDPFDVGMTSHRAVHLSHPTAWPPRFVVERGACEDPDCTQCVRSCPVQAIDLTMTDRQLEREINAVIWATGWEPYDARHLDELGFGVHPDVITSMMLERLASPQGPTGGCISRPSDGSAPQRIAFVQCAGSRDDAHLRYCSGLCCLVSAKQVRYLRAQHPEAEIYVFYIDLRAFGRFEAFLADTQAQDRTHFVHGKVARITADARGPIVHLEDVAQAQRRHWSMDLVVLATGMVPVSPNASVEALVRRDDDGFFVGEQPQPGLIPAGCARAPLDVASCVRDATSAALRALEFCVPSPGHHAGANHG